MTLWIVAVNLSNVLDLFYVYSEDRRIEKQSIQNKYDS